MTDYTSTRRCGKCGNEYPLTNEFFYKDKRNPQGLTRQCKECQKAMARKWQQENPEKAKQKSREYREKNRDKLCEYMKAYNPKYREANRDKRHYHDKLYRQRYPEKAREKQKRYRDRHPDRAYLRHANWIDKNPLYNATAKNKRRALKRGKLGILSPSDWQRALDYFGNRCAVCGRPYGDGYILAQDHWVALSNGGDTTPQNIIPLCHSKTRREGDAIGCNSSKHNKHAVDWLEKRFGKEKSLEIMSRIHAYFESLATE
jgi:hypothetical protein